jgi:hypothetical protein
MVTRKCHRAVRIADVQNIRHVFYIGNVVWYRYSWTPCVY